MTMCPFVFTELSIVKREPQPLRPLVCLNSLEHYTKTRFFIRDRLYELHLVGTIK